MKVHAIPTLALLVLLANAAIARADEIRLKDGTKISGTIVGFENGSFRVETSYGFALVEKDKVADISITAAKKDSDPKPKANAAAPPPVPAPLTMPVMAKETHSESRISGATGVPPAANRGNKATNPTAKSDCPQGAICDPGEAHLIAPQPHPEVSTVSVEPPAIRDEVRGNLYVNHTYGFQMYKPPSWDMIPEARKALPDAVAALGTFDQTTMLVIGRERAKDSLDAHATGTSKALGGVYENYRVISTRNLTIAGLPAIEQRSRGTADGRDWSVILLTFLRGEDAFTLLGMTWADSDLIQVQENVISKTVNSLQFQ
jgi:hypothetical protein